MHCRTWAAVSRKPLSAILDKNVRHQKHRRDCPGMTITLKEISSRRCRELSDGRDRSRVQVSGALSRQHILQRDENGLKVLRASCARRLALELQYIEAAETPRRIDFGAERTPRFITSITTAAFLRILCRSVPDGRDHSRSWVRAGNVQRSI